MADTETSRLADATDDTAPAISAEDETLLKELRDDYDYDVENLTKIRAEAAIDVAYAANETWTKDDEVARAGRPILNLDQISQYRNQIENSVRMNKRGVKVSPAGNGATKESAELRANRIREIEYQSHAQEAYSQMFSDCLTRGYGFARIVAEYEDEDTDNQVFRTKSIPNPDQVIPDSDGQSTSGRDWKRCVFLDSMSHAEFRRRFPHAKIKNFDADVLVKAGKWITSTRVQVAECWRLHETPNPKGYGRPHREVCMYLTNGVELLADEGQPAKHPWKGKYIPFAACYGRIVYKTNATGDSEKMILSYHRFARDAAKGYNWTKSTILEKLALPVKASLMGYEGQAGPAAIAAIERATQVHVPWIEFKPIVDGATGQILPLPQYGTREPDIQADMIAADGYQRDIQNALGHYNASDTSLGRTKVTSGVALDKLKQSGDLGSYDFQDHYDDSLKFLGEQYDDLLTSYDDTPKEIATRLPDDNVKMEWVNRMTGRAQDGSAAYGPKDLRMDVGRHTITISTGPTNDSQREAGKDAAMALLANPQAFPVIAADSIKLLDLGPVGDQMAEALEFLQPPEMQQARQQKKQGEPPDPRQLQQELAKLKEQLQQLDGIAKQMDGELKGKQAELANKLEIAKLEIASKEKLADEQSRREAETRLAVAEIGAKVKDDEFFREEQARLGVLDDNAADRAQQYQMHREKLEHAAQLAQQADETKRQATRGKRKINITRGEDGSLVSASIEGDQSDQAGT